MMKPAPLGKTSVLSMPELRDRLKKGGHEVDDRDSSDARGIAVWPSPKRIITVAVEPDGTLKKPYRRRFFTCSTDAELVLQRAGCAGQLQGPWLDVLGRFNPTAGIYHDFVAGSGSWAFSQLSHEYAIWLWPDDQPYWGWLPATFEDVKSYWSTNISLPSILAHFHNERVPKATLVSTRRADFVELFVACILLTSSSCQNCFAADSEFREVYYIHHHDKVVASIPNDARRRATLQGLRFNPDLYQDVSGYASTMDEDEEEGR
jgi:hypothetical protein